MEKDRQPPANMPELDRQTNPPQLDEWQFYWDLRRLSADIAPLRKMYLEMPPSGTPSISDADPVLRLMRDRLPQRAGRILDVGGGDRRLGGRISSLVEDAHYQSVDPNPAGNHDFQSLAEVGGEYDIITLLDVIEHVPYKTAWTLLRDCIKLLSPGGSLFVSTPNPAHPTCLMATDMTHCQHYPAHQLVGLLRLAGYSPEPAAFRVFMTADRGRLGNWIFRRLHFNVHRVATFCLGVDHCQELLMIASRPTNA